MNISRQPSHIEYQMSFNLSEFFKEIPHITALQKNAQKNKIRMYLVGGALRDYFLGRPVFDFDFAVSRHAIKMTRQFAKKIKGVYVLLDQEHGCARVVKKQQGQIWTFDFSDFRDNTIQGDLSHRDFTINTLCVDLKQLNGTRNISEILMDPKGGLKDLKRKKIRMVSAQSFKEDPLRIIRTFSLQAILGFSIDRKTLQTIKKQRHLLREVSYERIRDEFFKILAVGGASKYLRDMDRVGLLEEIIPQISVMFHVKQGDYHHLDVWKHSLETVFQLEKLLKKNQDNQDLQDYLREDLGGGRIRSSVMKLAALLHDIGKPDAKRMKKKRTLFYGHERIGKDIVRQIALMLKLSTRERHVLEDMVYWHLRPGYLSNFKRPSPRSVFRFFRDAKKECLSILLLSLADQKATCGPLTSNHDQRHHERIVTGLIGNYLQESKKEPFVPLINGDDLIRKLRLKPSPLFGKILAEIQEQQVTGEVETKEEALSSARKIAQEETKKKRPCKQHENQKH